MEIALARNNVDILILLASFAEVPACLDFLKMILQYKGEEQYAAEFKKNLECFSVSEVRSIERLQIRFRLAGAGNEAGLAVASRVRCSDGQR